jgi:transposase
MKSEIQLIKKRDLRSETSDGRRALRRRGMAMIQAGTKKGEVAKILGVNKNTVTNWCKNYKREGAKGLVDKKRGVKKGARKTLTDKQEIRIQRLIVDQFPEQYKLPFALWTLKAVQELVKQEFDLVVPRSTMGYYLRSWGFTPQKPKKKAYEQRPAEVAKWLEEEYPAIQERARLENAEIHWGDETGCKNQSNQGRSYAPKGQTPIKEQMSKSFKINLVSAITNQGKVQFMIYSENMNADVFIKFLQQLIKSCDRKKFLILDNLKVHHSKVVKEWVIQEEVKSKLELFFLPAYSPELNPDEYLNCDLKQGLSDKPAPKNEKELRINVEKHMTMLKQNPERIKKYFKHDSIKYAAENPNQLLAG